MNLIQIIIGVLFTITLHHTYKRYIFPYLLNYLMKGLHQKLHEKVKKKAFKEAFDQLKNNRLNDNNKPLEILEVGVGTGENFRLYPSNAKISYLDKTDVFVPYLKNSFEKDNRNPNDFKLIVAEGENMSPVESNSKDLVVHTFILCSVNDPAKVLDEIYRVLKPGGVCVFIEHSLEDNPNWRRLIQKIINPIWSFFFECKFRPMKNILESSKYNQLKIKFYNQQGLVFSLSNPFVYGLGIKE